MIFIHALSLLASPQDQRASAADTIVSNIVIKNNLFLSEQSLFFENLIWFDHILSHQTNWAGKTCAGLRSCRSCSLAPGTFSLRVVKKLLILHQTVAQVAAFF